MNFEDIIYEVRNCVAQFIDLFASGSDGVQRLTFGGVSFDP
jgi:hypothetical protein